MDFFVFTGQQNRRGGFCVLFPVPSALCGVVVCVTRQGAVCNWLDVRGCGCGRFMKLGRARPRCQAPIRYKRPCFTFRGNSCPLARTIIVALRRAVQRLTTIGFRGRGPAQTRFVCYRARKVVAHPVVPKLGHDAGNGCRARPLVICRFPAARVLRFPRGVACRAGRCFANRCMGHLLDLCGRMAQGHCRFWAGYCTGGPWICRPRFGVSLRQRPKARPDDILLAIELLQGRGPTLVFWVPQSSLGVKK